MLVLLATLLGAQQGLQLSAEVDRERVNVGSEITYAVRVVLAGDAPVRTFLPGFDGFTLVDRSERREQLPALPTTLIMEFRLRADQVGQWLVGPLRVEQGGEVALSPEVLVEVTAPGARAAPTLSPRVRAMLDRAAPPVRGDVAVTLLASSDRLVAGDQLDLVTAAWFPRQLLARLRRPPELRPPTVEGVFHAVQPSVAGVGTSRLIGGVWYDLYVAHQVVFPLTPGVLAVPPAGLTFSVPQGRQYFSEEKPYRLESTPLEVTITAVPAGPAAGGPAARRLALGYELVPDPAVAGQPIPVTLVLEGAGNVALWPPPAVEWPEGTRGYADRPVEQVRQPAGVIEGTKRFRFTVLADSAGSLVLPRVRYDYFDLDRNQWEAIVAEPVVLPVQPASDVLPRREPTGIMTTPPGVLTGIALPSTGLVLLLVAGPPLLAAGVLVLRRRRRPAGALVIGSPRDRLVRIVHQLVPEHDRWRQERIAAALRRSGADAEASRDTSRLYLDLAVNRFGPAPATDADLDDRIVGVLARLPRRLLLIMVVLAPAAGMAQPAPEPVGAVAMAWYNRGAESYRAGRDAQAAAAWVEALRLAPRDQVLREAWERMALRAPDLERWGWALPITPGELFLLGAGCWAIGWGLLAVQRRRGPVWLVIGLVLFGASASLAGWYRLPLGVVNHQAMLREAPHGLAQPVGQLDALSVVRVLDRRTGWRLVRLPSGAVGWAPAAALAETARLDSGA